MLLNFQRAGTGEPLVLLHGIGGELYVWEPIFEALADARDVIALDLPGHGGSPQLPAGVSPTPAALAEAVAACLAELGIAEAHYAGNSLGGWIALELAKSGRARSVTALSPAGLWGAPLLGQGLNAPGRAHHAVHRLRRLLPLLMRSSRARRLMLGHVFANPDRLPYTAALRLVNAYAAASGYDATNTAMRQTCFEGAERIAVPITLAFGEHDRLVRPVRLASDWSRSLTLPGCGHIPMWDDPGLVSRLVLDGLQAPELLLRGIA